MNERGALAHKGRARARQIASLPLRLGRDKAGAHQPVAQQFSDPLGIFHSGLASRHRLPPSTSQSERRSSSPVVVPNVCVWASGCPFLSRVSRQATTVRFCTSIPYAHRSPRSAQRRRPSGLLLVASWGRFAAGVPSCRKRAGKQGHRCEQHLTYALPPRVTPWGGAAASGSCRCRGPTIHQACCTQLRADLCASPARSTR